MSQFTLFSNENVILLQPNKPNHPVLKLSRPDGKVTLIPASSEFSVTSFGPFDLSLKCYGIYGLIELLAGKYLIVITGQSLIGSLPGSEAEIRQITKVEIIPCGYGMKELSPPLRSDENEYLALLNDALNKSAPMASGLYYSNSVALSRSIQSQFIKPQSVEDWKLSCTREEDEFVVNSVHLKEFSALNKDVCEFICCCIQGFVEVRDLVVNQSKITFALVSKRNVSRTGARYHCRGIDSKGNVANFVETEQLIFTPNGRCASFLQIRGSMPFYWKQNVRIKYKPELEIVENAPSKESFILHHKSTINKYKRVAIANLVDSHGGEAQLSAIFSKLSSEVVAVDDKKNNLKYVEFDFHSECRKMAYENIRKLVAKLENELNEFGYFEGNLSNGKIIKQQIGIVRTNCMDCLDRTNVVQSVLARRALLEQLKDFEILDKSSTFKDFGSVLEGIFRNVWADNADAISTQYSGTGALKTDFTRTGKRTAMGALQDGINSALRYYFGNFTDGRRQDSLDLLFGAFKVDPTKYTSPFQNIPTDPIKKIVLWTLLYSAILLFFFSHFKTEFSTRGMLISIFIIIALLQFIKSNGKRFVQKPRLQGQINP